MTVKRPKLILFAKTPVIGKVKTRLCPPLIHSQACDLAVILIEKSIENVKQHWPGEVELSVWPERENPALQRIIKKHNIKVSTQSTGDLGEKMYSAMRQNLNNGQHVLIMGCDVPHCDRDYLINAYQGLENSLNVIGPTHDGGYYCVGVNQSHGKNVRASTMG